MRKYIFIILLLTVWLCITGQTSNSSNLYQRFKDFKPKYKKIVYYELKDSSRLIPTSSETWKRKKNISTSYMEALNMTTGKYELHKWTSTTYYNSRKKNETFTKFYQDDKFEKITYHIKQLDTGIILNTKKEVVYKSIYSSSNNSWLRYNYQGRDKIRTLFTVNPTHTIEIEYKNDTLILEIITYYHKQFEDSCLTYDGNKKLINRIHQFYNDRGDIFIKEETDLSAGKCLRRKTIYAYKYNNKGDWIEMTATTTQIKAENKIDENLDPQIKIMKRRIYY